MKKLFLITLLFALCFGKIVYFLPQDGFKAQKKLIYLFSHAKSVKILIYTFTNKKLAKALKIAAKNGAKITIVADKKEAHFKYSVIPNLALIKNIQVYLLTGKTLKDKTKAKMHVKMSIIDNKYLIIGSANYSYSAFFKNYEYILILEDKKLIEKFNDFFYKLKSIATPYKFSR